MADVTDKKVEQQENLNDLKVRLDATKQGDKDLYKHCVKTLSHLVKHCPHDTLNNFEEVSYLMKHSDRLDHKDFLKSEVHKEYAKPADESTKETTSQIISSTQGMFPAAPIVQKAAEGEDPPADPEPVAPIGLMPDIIADSRVWQWAGVGFGEYELMLLQKSLKNLAKSSGSTSLKLWGKIKGTEQDYYVAEGSLAAEEGAEVPEGVEARGTGVNEFVYWVCNSAVGEWTQLPDLKPSDIQNARSIKVNFSGHLEKQIYTNPFFFATEKVYLRAQIARIHFSTNLVPKGHYRFKEESTREIEDNAPEEGEMKKRTVQEMCDASNWVHYTPNILKQARLTHKEGKPLEGEEEVDPEVLAAREVAKDPWEPRLKPITDDAKTLGGMPAWIVRSYDTEKQFVDDKTGKQTKNYGTVVCKSLWWPGQYSFYNNERMLSIYCGNGLKHEQETYYPVSPPTMMDEKPEKECWGEPNPTEEWKKLRAEWEANKDKGDQPAE